METDPTKMPVLYGMDYFLYHYGKKVRKYWTHRDGWNHFWPPVLAHLSRIERLYHQAVLRSNKHYAKIPPLIDQILKVAPKLSDVWPDFPKQWWHEEQVVFARALHSKGANDWWIFGVTGPDNQFNISEGWPYSYHFDWVNEKDMPKGCPVEVELGQQLYDLDYRLKPKWRWKLANVLDEAISKYIRENMPESWPNRSSNKAVCLVINGRHYWLNLYWERAFLHVKKLHWPDDPTTFHEVKDEALPYKFP